MSAQDSIVANLKRMRGDLSAEIARLHHAAKEAEGGNLAEVYTGARDWLSEADTAVRLALQTLAPEEEL